MDEVLVIAGHELDGHVGPRSRCVETPAYIAVLSGYVGHSAPREIRADNCIGSRGHGQTARSVLCSHVVAVNGFAGDTEPEKRIK